MSHEKKADRSLPLGCWLVAVVVGFGAVVLALFPSAWSVLDTPYEEGHDLAIRHWKQGRAVVFIRGVMPRSYVHRLHHVKRYYDRERGLRIESVNKKRNSQFYEGYNAAIDGLVASHGIPGWSAAGHIPTDDEMIAKLEASRGEKVSRIPYKITPSLVLFEGREYSPSPNWSWHAQDSVLAVGTPEDVVPIPRSPDGIFVERDDKYPDTVFLRVEKSWVGAFHRDGKLLVEVTFSSNGDTRNRGRTESGRTPR